MMIKAKLFWSLSSLSLITIVIMAATTIEADTHTKTAENGIKRATDIKSISGTESFSSASKDSFAEHARKHSDPNYICPMHPQIQQGEKGACPICGMDLVLKAMKTSEGDGLPVVTVSSSTAQSMGVRMGEVRELTMARSINAVGYVQYDEDKIAHIHARASGWIKRPIAKTLGDRVEKGQLLTHYYAPDIHTAQENYLTTLRSSNDRQRQIDSLTRLKALEIPDTLIRNLEQNATITPYIPVNIFSG